MPQGAEAPQHRGGEMAHQGAVALGEFVKLAGLEQFVQRALAAKHAGDDVGGDAARGEAGWRSGWFGGYAFGHGRLSCPAFTRSDNAAAAALTLACTVSI
jgi:hypothetical protein